jgi:hypothetical protein
LLLNFLTRSHFLRERWRRLRRSIAQRLQLLRRRAVPQLDVSVNASPTGIEAIPSARCRIKRAMGFSRFLNRRHGLFGFGNVVAFNLS